MKAKIFSLMALVLCLVSCQTEPEGLDVIVSGEQEVMVNVALPEGTRASSDQGFDLNNLGDYRVRYILEIYLKDSNGNVNYDTCQRFFKICDAKSVAFPVRLVPNRNYQVTAWADIVYANNADVENWYQADRCYNTTGGLDAISIIDTEWRAMDETRDAYTDTETVTNFTSGTPIDLYLKRPFAKVRVVTTDIEQVRALGFEPTTATVVYSELMLRNFNAVSGTATATGAAAKSHGITYNPSAPFYTDAEGEMTLFADYIFVPADGTIQFNLEVEGIKSYNFNTEIPVKANNLTTIKGYVLTEGGDVKVEIEDEFENGQNPNDPPYYVEIWDGESIEAPAYDETTKTYTVKNGSHLAWLAAAVNGTLPEGQMQTRSTNYDFAGKIFKLEADIDLGGNPWTPISMSTNLSAGETFRGTFDGQGHVISGLNVEQPEVAGLFGYIYAATIKNVTIEGATIKSNHFAGGVVAWVLNNRGNIQVPFVMENCHVKNSTITSTPIEINGKWDNGDKVGGLVGYACFGDADYSPNADAKISGCSVENTSIKAYRDFAGLLGYASYVALEECVVTNVTLEQDLTHDYKAPNTPTTYGMIIGRDNGGNTVDGYNYISDGLYKKGKTYMVKSAQGLVALSERPIEGGESVLLGADIDLKDVEFNGLNAFNPENNNTFDGQGHTVSNWTYTGEADDMGFIRNWVGPIKNLTIKNAILRTGGRSAVIVAKPYGNIENCHVVDCNLQANYWACGLIVGMHNSGNIKDCSATNSYIKSTGGTGAITGVLNETDGTRTFTNCTVTGCTINCTNDNAAKPWYAGGAIVGLVNLDYSTIEFNGCQTSDNIFIGQFSKDSYYGYSFSPVKINGASLVSTVDELNAAIKAGAEKIMLVNGSYTIPSSAQGKTLHLVGIGDAEDIDITVSNENGSYEGCNYNLSGSTVTFENISINTPSTTYIGYAGCKGTYKNCIINGAYWLYDNSSFEKCTLNISGDNYNIWTWSAPSATFTNCTFNTDGKSVLLYGAANTELTINNCVFNDNGGLVDELKAAIEVGDDYGSSYELIVNNTVVNGFAINNKGINTGTTLWGNKNSMSQERLNVVVDGVDVY